MTTMNAITHTQYGSPEVLRLAKIERPQPGPEDVLVQIHAAALNPGDLYAVQGIGRFNGDGLFRPKYAIPGADMAGEVIAVGDRVVRFQPGDQVFGDLSVAGRGAWAEYAAVPERALAAKPDNLSYAQAAGVPMAGVTALQGLRTHGDLQPGERVLINGASGGVGTFAVQIAKALGAEVTAVCSAKKAEMVQSIGADRIIDYRAQNFTQLDQQYDLIFDTVGNHSVKAYQRALLPAGRFVTTRFLPGLMIRNLWPRQKQTMMGMMANPNGADLAFLSELIGDAEVVPVIDRRYPLARFQDALAHLARGHAAGKVVLEMGRAMPHTSIEPETKGNYQPLPSPPRLQGGSRR